MIQVSCFTAISLCFTFVMTFMFKNSLCTQQNTLSITHNLNKYVDLIYGRGITNIIREIPLYFGMFEKTVVIKVFHQKPAIYGSVDVINFCNLQCTHCYWWLNRKEEGQELSADQWRQ
jgi:hypothetical protein